MIPFSMHDGRMRKVYNIKLTFHPNDRYPPYLQLEMHEFESALRHQFVPSITREMGKAVAFRSGEKAKDAIRVLSLSQLGEWEEDTGNEDDEDSKVKISEKSTEHGEQVEEDEGEMGTEEDGADAEKRRAQETDERSYDEEADDDESMDGHDNGDGDTALTEDDGSEVEEGAEKRKDNNKHARVEDEKDGSVSPQTDKSRQSNAPVGKVRSTFDGSCFEMRLAVKHNTPHILLSEVFRFRFHHKNCFQVYVAKE